MGYMNEYRRELRKRREMEKEAYRKKHNIRVKSLKIRIKKEGT